MNWTEILLKGRYPLFLLYSVIDGEVANFVGSTLAGNGIFNIFLIYTLSVFMEVLIDTIYYSLGKKIPLKKILKKLLKTEKGQNIVKSIDSRSLSKPYLTVFVVKFSGPLAIPGLLYLGNLGILKLPRFITTSLIIAVLKGIAVSFFGYMTGRGFAIFSQIWNGVHIIVTMSILFIIGYMLVRLLKNTKR